MDWEAIMSHRRLSSHRLSSRNENEPSEVGVDDCDLMTEVSITGDRQNKHEGTVFAHLSSYPSKLGSWLNSKLDHMFDEKSDDFSKLLPSVVSFLLGLLVVKIYGDTLDSAIVECFNTSSRMFGSLYTTLSKLDCEDFENIASVIFVLLFWIGAARVVGNLARKIISAPKFYQ